MTHSDLLGMHILSADLKGALNVSPNPPRYYGSPVGSSCMQILGKPGLLFVVEVLKISLMLSQTIFNILQGDNVSDHPHLVREVADSLKALGHYKSALKYYMMLEGIDEDKDVRKTILPFIFVCFDLNLCGYLVTVLMFVSFIF